MTTMRWLVPAVALGLAMAGPALAQKTLKVQTSQSAGDFTFQYMSEQWAPKIAAMTGEGVIATRVSKDLRARVVRERVHDGVLRIRRDVFILLAQMHQ